ncbi:MAG: hypothetical protein FWG94_05435 [Oscillospiraceae bacterium]|nr:hypothetical protein [Oscillospiraceae bacterium]
MPKAKTEKGLTYKGRPLVRNGGTIYYGNMSDDYVAMLQILETGNFSDEFPDMKMPQKVSVQILSTDAEMRPKERVKKRTEKNNLYDALKIASIWLERILEKGE